MSSPIEAGGHGLGGLNSGVDSVSGMRAWIDQASSVVASMAGYGGLGWPVKAADCPGGASLPVRVDGV